MRKPFNKTTQADDLFSLFEKLIDGSQTDHIDVTDLMQGFLSYQTLVYKELIDEAYNKLKEYGWQFVHNFDRENNTESWTIKPLK